MDTVILCVLFWGLALITFFDVKYRQIPNKILIFLIVFRVAAFIIMRNFTLTKFVEILFFAIIGIIFYFIFKNKIGAGDIKLEIVISLYLTAIDFIYALFISMLTMFVYGISVLCLKKVTLKTKIPLSPFIMIGVIASVLVI